MTTEEQGNNSNGQHGETALWIAKALFNTDRERLPELTDIPLDQVRPLSMMTTYLKEIEMLCDDIKKAQAWYTTNYQKYHKNSTELVNMETDEEFNTDKITALMNEWLYRYFQLRRSVKGEYVRHGVVLAQDQMASQQQEGVSMDDLVDRVKSQ